MQSSGKGYQVSAAADRPRDALPHVPML